MREDQDEDYIQVYCSSCEETVYFGEYSSSRMMCWDCVSLKEEQKKKTEGFGPLIEIIKEITVKA